LAGKSTTEARSTLRKNWSDGGYGTNLLIPPFVSTELRFVNEPAVFSKDNPVSYCPASGKCTNPIDVKTG
jgi:hypothetical protein